MSGTHNLNDLLHELQLRRLRGDFWLSFHEGAQLLKTCVPEHESVLSEEWLGALRDGQQIISASATEPLNQQNPMNGEIHWFVLQLLRGERLRLSTPTELSSYAELLALATETARRRQFTPPPQSVGPITNPTEEEGRWTWPAPQPTSGAKWPDQPAGQDFHSRVMRTLKPPQAPTTDELRVRLRKSEARLIAAAIPPEEARIVAALIKPDYRAALMLEEPRNPREWEDQRLIRRLNPKHRTFSVLTAWPHPHSRDDHSPEAVARRGHPAPEGPAMRWTDLPVLQAENQTRLGQLHLSRGERGLLTPHGELIAALHLTRAGLQAALQSDWLMIPERMLATRLSEALRLQPDLPPAWQARLKTLESDLSAFMQARASHMDGS